MSFSAKLRQHYKLTDTALLVLEEDYSGDVGPGDVLQIEVGEGHARFTVHDLAWGSSMDAQRLPLSLIVKGLDEVEPEPGAAIGPISD